MDGSLYLKTAPATEPVTTAEAKLHLKVDITDDDTLIAGLVVAARRWIEDITGIRMVSQTWNYYLDSFPDAAVIKLPLGPVSAVSSIKSTDSAGAVTTFSTGSYVTDLVSLPARVVLKSSASWPSNNLREVNGVDIEFVTGWANAAAVPEELKLAVKMLVAYWYENREAAAGAVGSTDIKQLPLGLQSMIQNYRMWQR